MDSTCRRTNSLCELDSWFYDIHNKAVVLLYTLKQTLGMGTIMNAIIVVLYWLIFLPIIPDINNFYGKLLFVFLGIIITGFGGSIYLISNLGPGPRDGLMTGMQKKTNLPLHGNGRFLQKFFKQQ